mgnify:CR=1 FL=1
MSSSASEQYGQTHIGGNQASGNPHRVKGRHQDTPCSYKCGKRFLNSSTGSWTQQDSIAGTVQNPGAVNRYPYAGSNPCNNTDPTGRDWGSCAGASIAYGADLHGLGAALTASGVAAPVEVFVGGIGFAFSASFFVHECFPSW